MEELSERQKSLLKSLAVKYEKPDFMTGDPSRVLRRYRGEREQEISAFITAQISFGKRELFLAKADSMFAHIDSTAALPGEWLLSGAYKEFFPKSEKKFYRFFSFSDMRSLCARLAQILEEYGSLGNAVRTAWEKIRYKDRLSLVTALVSLFPGIKCVAQNPKGACKKLHMFLRWMVRKNSPVDLGLWQWADPKDLLIPLDVHVMQEGIKLALLPANSAPNAKTALLLTESLAQIWPADPVKGDFALFGLGVDK